MGMADRIRSSLMPIMESSLENSDHVSAEDIKLKSNYGDDEEGDDHVMHVKQEENSRNQPPSTVKDIGSLMHADELRSTKAQIGEVTEENERLKKLLSKAVKDYESLQKHFSEVAKEEEENKSSKIKPVHQENEKPELIFLSLGRSSSEPRKEEKKSSNISGENEELNDNNKGLLSLGLDFKIEADSSLTMNNNNYNNNLSSASNTFDEEEEPKEEEPSKTTPPSKVLNTTRSSDDEVLQQTQMKKARVSVRTRCEAPTMNDGCQWRKYGQKIAKGNPCPRAYYRCTVSPACPVRKQVQRCAEDMSILITTYEGTHNHPLPLSATAMASTTSAAISMLQSQSSTSQLAGTSSSISAPSSFSNTQNFTFSTQNDNPLIKPSNRLYFPNSSISTNNLHPTITLDLTTPITNKPPKCFNFSSSSSSFDSTATFQSPWTHPTGYPTYNRYNDNGSYMTDQNIVAAAKVIALDPNFRSALAAAITSFVGNNNNNIINNYNNNNPGGNLGDHQSLTYNYPISSQIGIVNGCGSSYLFNNKSAPNNTNNNLRSQNQGSMALFPSPLQQFSSSKNSSGSPANSSRDHNKSS